MNTLIRMRSIALAAMAIAAFANPGFSQESVVRTFSLDGNPVKATWDSVDQNRRPTDGFKKLDDSITNQHVSSVQMLMRPLGTYAESSFDISSSRDFVATLIAYSHSSSINKEFGPEFTVVLNHSKKEFCMSVDCVVKPDNSLKCFDANYMWDCGQR